MKLYLLLGVFIGIAAYSGAQTTITETLILIGSSSASNGGFHFSNVTGDTIYACPSHPDSCLVKHKMKGLYAADGPPELAHKFAKKKYLVTLVVYDPTMADNGDGPCITATAITMELIK